MAVENKPLLLRRGGTVLMRGWPCAAACPASHEEEGLVPLDRPAHSQAILVAAELRPGARLGEVIARVEVFVANELKQRAVQIVAAGFSPPP